MKAIVTFVIPNDFSHKNTPNRVFFKSWQILASSLKDLTRGLLEAGLPMPVCHHAPLRGGSLLCKACYKWLLEFTFVSLGGDEGKWMPLIQRWQAPGRRARPVS